MADQTIAHADDDAGLQALTQERMRMWQGFTNATMASVTFVVLLLIGMAIFLL